MPRTRRRLLVRLAAMTPTDDYCDLCELPKSQCLHGQPPAAPKKAVTSPPKPRKRPTTKRPSAAVPVPAKRVVPRWTPPEAFKPLILTALERAGGELDAEELFSELRALAEDRLLPGDSERTPEGELRWRYAARRARMTLIGEGLMRKDKPGVWQLAR